MRSAQHAGNLENWRLSTLQYRSGIDAIAVVLLHRPRGCVGVREVKTRSRVEWSLKSWPRSFKKACQSVWISREWAVRSLVLGDQFDPCSDLQECGTAVEWGVEGEGPSVVGAQ